MNLLDTITRSTPPAPWTTGDKIPWNELEFSQRMLELHLCQDHDWASRRFDTIDRHVAWLASQLPNRGARILDLGCGPGLYAQRLARLGHRCVGIDFSPASIEYAKQQAAQEHLDIRYELADLRQHEIAGQYDLAMMVFGEFNVFRKCEVETMLAKTSVSLKPGGRLVIEIHPFDEVRRQGLAPAFWQSAQTGLFSDRPHFWLQEQFWDEATATTTTRYLIVDAERADVTEYGSTMQAYTDKQLRKMLEAAGMSNVKGIEESDWPAGEGLTDKLRLFACEKALS